MPNGYGNNRDRLPPEEDRSIDHPHPARSIAQKIAHHMSEGPRDTPRNRRMAKEQGWTDDQFEQWATGHYDDENVRDG